MVFYAFSMSLLIFSFLLVKHGLSHGEKSCAIFSYGFAFVATYCVSTHEDTGLPGND